MQVNRGLFARLNWEINRMRLRLFVCSMVSLSVFIQCASPPVFDEAAWLELIEGTDGSLVYAPHVRDGSAKEEGVFFNPWLPSSPLRGKRSWFWSRMFRQKSPFDSFPEEQYAAVPNDYTYLADPHTDSISYVGHASLIIKMDNETIFTDPFFSNTAMVVRKKIRIPFDFSKVPPKPVVLISHNHYDHLDKFTVKQLITKDAIFIVPLRLKDFFVQLGAQTVYELDWWESVTLGSGESGITYTLLPAQHWSRRIGQKARSTLWGGFMIEGSKNIYFSGDSGYFKGFAEFGKRYDIDYAIVGVGAYEPRWFMHYSHLNVAEFFRAVDDLGAKKTIPMHFGIISLSDEPLLYPLYEIDQFIRLHPEYTEKIHSLRTGELITITEQ